MFKASDKSTVTMTELLERAIARLKTSTASEQDALAAMILEELEDEIRSLWSLCAF